MLENGHHDSRNPMPGAGPIVQKPPIGALGTALWLLARGLWPVAISPAGDPRWPSPGKSPIGKGWGRRRPSPASLRRLFDRHPRAGVGLLLGPAGGVVDLETDEPASAAAELRRLFPADVPETMGWRSVRGEHRVFAWDDRLAELARTAVVSFGDDGALELRVGGHGKQVASVCPPSPTAEGTPRAWNGCWRIAPFPEQLVSALRQSGRLDAGPPSSPPRRVPPKPWRRPDGRGRYGAAALARESELVRDAQPGSRNRTLNRAAFALGQLVAGGAIGRAAVESALLDAAQECGLGPKEAEATIRSGIDAGLDRPRSSRG
jgi:hypothetical protein